MIYLQLILEFLKIGTFAIGGYSSMALVMDEMRRLNWMTNEELIDMIAIAESTPGPITVNMATYVGAMKAGISGAIVATLAEILPAFVIILIASLIMNKIIKNKIIEEAFTIIRPAVTGIIISIGLIFILEHTFNIINIYTLSNFTENKKSIILFIIFYIITIIYKKITKKEIGAIKLILISAVCGILINNII